MTHWKQRLVSFSILLLLGVSPGMLRALQQSSAPVTQESATEPAWMAALAARHKSLIESNGPGTNLELQAHLLHMAKIDQDARTGLMEQAKSTGTQPDMQKLTPIDLELTQQMKQIVWKSGWPTIHLVGYDASAAAMLIVAHTRDYAWQAGLLPQLEKLAAEDKIDSSQLALIVDKELVAAGHPQRYGTQFKFVDGKMAMYTVENPAQLDTRRAIAMLPPLDIYKSMLAAAYGMPASDEIIPPPPPAKP